MCVVDLFQGHSNQEDSYGSSTLLNFSKFSNEEKY